MKKKEKKLIRIMAAVEGSVGQKGRLFLVANNRFRRRVVHPESAPEHVLGADGSDREDRLRG